MEDLILAFVTFVASMYIFDRAHAGMDAFVIVMLLAPMPLVGYLAYERRRSPWRWVYAGVIIGPLAISMLYFLPLSGK